MKHKIVQGQCSICGAEGNELYKKCKGKQNPVHADQNNVAQRRAFEFGILLNTKGAK